MTLRLTNLYKSFGSTPVLEDINIISDRKSVWQLLDQMVQEKVLSLK